MSKQTNQKPQPAVFGPFGGMDTRMPHGGTPSAGEIVNFRLSEDGSLIKREGCHFRQELPNYIRASWSGKLFGENYTLLLVGFSVMRLNTETEKATLLGEISHSTSGSEDEAQFFFYRDRLYLLDGERVYQIDKNAVTPIEAYVPLVGKDWPNTHVGEIYEPRNLLTRRARIHYIVGEEVSVFLRTAYSVESVESLSINGEILDPSEYFYEEPIQSIICQKLKSGDHVRVLLTYTSSVADESAPSPALSCTRVEIFGDSQINHLLLWNGRKKNTFYPSVYISEEHLEASREVVPDSVPLYFPEHAGCVLGDGRSDITGFLRQYDRLLIFTESETWMTTTDVSYAPSFSAKPINPMIGCTSPDACIMIGNSPITVGTHGIYRWGADTDEYSMTNAVSICEPIRSRLNKSFFYRAKILHHPTRNELWFYTPFADSDIWIYHLSDGAWYRFTSMDHTGLFEAGGKVFLCYYNHLGVFGEPYHDDLDPYGTSQPIVAEFQSNLLEYGTTAQKHFSSLTLRGDLDGGTLSVRLLGDSLQPIECSFSDDAVHTVASRRLSSGRFHAATLQLRADGQARPTIHSLISDVR